MKPEPEQHATHTEGQGQGEEGGPGAGRWSGLARLHAVLQERDRYAPCGWSRAHGFSDADAAYAIAVTDTGWTIVLVPVLVLAPPALEAKQLPWTAMQVLLEQYGAKIDNDEDRAV